MYVYTYMHVFIHVYVCMGMRVNIQKVFVCTGLEYDRVYTIDEPS